MTRALALFVLASFCGVVALPATAQTPVVNPRIVEFDPSADHATLTADNRPMVERYQLQIFVAGAAQPLSTADLGKPAPAQDGKIRVDFSTLLAGWPLGDGTYQARVAALGPAGTGTSEPSNSFAFQATGCTVSLGSSGQSVPAAGAAGSVTISAGSSCSWTATTDAAWVTLGASAGTGSGSVSFQVAQNTSGMVRVASVSVGGQVVTLTQAAAFVCSYALSSASGSFGQGGGSGSVGISCGSSCAWAAMSTAAWVTIGAGNGTGAGTAAYVVAKNTTTLPRSATITIAGLTHTVNQAAANRPSAPKKVRTIVVTD